MKTNKSNWKDEKKGVFFSACLWKNPGVKKATIYP
ncbi:hypothetical protein T190130A13A_50077 [Tenacibaculum sp. 190130A14a]